MAADTPAVGSQFFEGATGRNTRGLLRLIILCTIAAAAIASRLFSVIRFESIIHECKTPREVVDLAIGTNYISPVDPWFNFRATKYLVANGFYKFWDWFDDSTWLLTLTQHAEADAMDKEQTY